jgi:glycosyltransferase involved in cell wall biosynthesis
MTSPTITQPSTSRPLVGRDMLCFSHDWTGDPLSKTHLMRILARDNRILWVNSIGYRTPQFGASSDLSRIWKKLKAAAQPIREVEKNLFVLNPLVIPAWGRASIRNLNARFLGWQVRRAMKLLRFDSPVNWVFNPAAGILAGRLGEREIIYYCVDEYTAFSGVNTSALLEIEAELLRKANLVIVSAEKLQQTKQSPSGPTLLVRHGVDYTHFRTALDPSTPIPQELAGLPKPIIGYFGLIADDWVDIPLLVHVARSFPQGTLVLVGKSTMDVSALAREPNVKLTGRMPYASLPGFCKGFDVALIPFPISPVTLHANPLKAREYLAAGLPVVSTAIPEVEVLGECRIGRTPEEFVAEIRAALASPGPDVERSARMATSSWEARLDSIRDHIATVEDQFRSRA